jgi:hypothetical protein
MSVYARPREPVVPPPSPVAEQPRDKWERQLEVQIEELKAEAVEFRSLARAVRDTQAADDLLRTAYRLEADERFLQSALAEARRMIPAGRRAISPLQRRTSF